MSKKNVWKEGLRSSEYRKRQTKQQINGNNEQEEQRSRPGHDGFSIERRWLSPSSRFHNPDIVPLAWLECHGKVETQAWEQCRLSLVGVWTKGW